MQLDLNSPAKKRAVIAAFVSLSLSYLTLSAAQMLATYFSQSHDERWLEAGAQLDQGNADARHVLGRFELLANHSPQAALPWLQSAVRLNPHDGGTWADLAVAQESSGDVDAGAASLQRALAADPRTPAIAWNAANLYLSQGDSDQAMQQFHTVLENDPYLTGQAIQTCWKARPDIDYLLAKVVPPNAYAQTLQFLVSRQETAAAAKVWQQMFSEQQTVLRQDLFDYVRYLVLHHEAAQAQRVWQEAAGMAQLQSYQPSPENLFVNGDFSLDILNGGFEWVHRKAEGVSLALDPNEAHSSSRSLRITFDGPGIDDAGISQIIAVEPNTNYEFSAFYKAEDIDGAGGMEFAIQDAYKGTSLFMSEDLRDADFWKKTGGAFTTGQDAELLILRILRVPPGSPIKGRLWIDGLHLMESGGNSTQAVTSASLKGPQ